MLVLDAVEQRDPVNYVRAGLQSEPAPSVYSSVRQIPDFAIAATGDAMKEPRFLILRDPSALVVQPVPQRAGGTRFAIDQSTSPQSILLAPGGSHHGAIIAGQLSTISEDPESMSLYRAVSGEVRKRFRKIRSYYVGPDAETRLRAGARLTIAVDASPKLDLQEV